ncbi:MAG: bifunctional phosphopantothenoylcysteine decarboxylase/phosphopantothenate--cysteine ligase CoaBC [Bdellovibrionales bacterium]|nr:bifunctional phosphopantothenoylcysteine decarboxylase/phosphopantothenate--cysteine ligase CoaBC [Bdellovibrionales bacterium]
MKRILFVVTGSIAAYKACQAVSRLAQMGYAVQAVATPSALRFVGAATLEGLTGRTVATDLWAGGRAMDHIRLIREADIAVVAPASAGFLNRISQGLADDLASTLFLAHDFQKPFLVAPAMNGAMLRHPATRASIRRLEEMGVEVLPSGAGTLACGEEDEGRLLDPDDLVSRIEARLSAPGPRVIVTSGGTREPIDDVRFLGNGSTGATGSAIAAALAARGMRVTLIRAAASAPAPAGVDARSFETLSDLETVLRHEIRSAKPSHLIHAAAVADFIVEKAEGKIPSGAAHSLRLQPAPKLLSRIRDWAGGEIRICGFKLTSGAGPGDRMEAVARVMEHSDLVVHNDRSEMREGRHPFRLHRRGAAEETIEGASALGRRLAEWVRETRP